MLDTQVRTCTGLAADRGVRAPAAANDRGVADLATIRAGDAERGQVGHDGEVRDGPAPEELAREPERGGCRERAGEECGGLHSVCRWG
jgi:hypothetical protein